MSSRPDFITGIVTSPGNDTFFLDSNVIVAYLYEKDEFHEVCALFLKYLISKDIILWFSEVVVMETINTLARIYYTDDQFSAWVQKRGLPRDRAHEKAVKKGIRTGWNDVIKTQPEKLQMYNHLACSKIKPFLDLCAVVPATEDQILEGMRMSYDCPLGSGDALIVSSAAYIEATGILSLDKDLQTVREIDVFTTNAKNDLFDPAKMIATLGDDFKRVLINDIGEELFEQRYSRSRGLRIVP